MDKVRDSIPPEELDEVDFLKITPYELTTAVFNILSKELESDIVPSEMQRKAVELCVQNLMKVHDLPKDLMTAIALGLEHDGIQFLIESSVESSYKNLDKLLTLIYTEHTE